VISVVIGSIPQKDSHYSSETQIYQPEERTNGSSDGYDHNAEAERFLFGRPSHPAKLAYDLTYHANAKGATGDLATDSPGNAWVPRHDYLTSRCSTC
jgi:hypothetical protein